MGSKVLTSMGRRKSRRRLSDKRISEESSATRDNACLRSTQEIVHNSRCQWPKRCLRRLGAERTGLAGKGAVTHIAQIAW